MNASFLVRPNPVGVMVDDGLVGSVGGDPGRDFLLWYVVAGTGLLTRAAGA